MIQKPILVVCRSDVAAMLTVSETGWFTDDNVPYEMVARSDPFAPAGQGGEAIFTTLWITTTTFETDVALFITPIIDFVPIDTQRIDIPGAPNPDDAQQVHELVLSVPYPPPPAAEFMRVAPRGCVIEVKVETRIGDGFGVSGRQIVDGIEVETEIVREGRAPTGVTV